MLRCAVCEAIETKFRDSPASWSSPDGNKIIDCRVGLVPVDVGCHHQQNDSLAQPYIGTMVGGQGSQ
jgi:hypothetical protein